MEYGAERVFTILRISPVTHVNIRYLIVFFGTELSVPFHSCMGVLRVHVPADARTGGLAVTQIIAGIEISDTYT